jgi:fumarate hydratase class I
MLAFLEDKIRSLGTAACPPYHLAIVIGGTSAEYALKTAKYASARYLDTLPAAGSPLGHGFRDPDLEQQVLEITRKIGIGAQFGGKYFCHDVRVIRLPRHGASCPVAIAVSCSADRQALAKITAEGVFLERLETDPAQYLPETAAGEPGEDVVRIDLTRPMSEIRAELSRYPVATRVCRCPATWPTTPSITRDPPRRRRATPPVPSGPPLPGGWTPMSISSRQRAGRWSCSPRATGQPR